MLKLLFQQVCPRDLGDNPVVLTFHLDVKLPLGAGLDLTLSLAVVDSATLPGRVVDDEDLARPDLHI